MRIKIDKKWSKCYIERVTKRAKFLTSDLWQSHRVLKVKRLCSFFVHKSYEEVV